MLNARHIEVASYHTERHLTLTAVDRYYLSDGGLSFETHIVADKERTHCLFLLVGLRFGSLLLVASFFSHCLFSHLLLEVVKLLSDGASRFFFSLSLLDILNGSLYARISLLQQSRSLVSCLLEHLLPFALQLARLLIGFC